MHMYGIIEAGTQEVRGCGYDAEHRVASGAFCRGNYCCETPLSDAIRAVYAELDAKHCDFIALTGNLACAGCFELYMSRLTLPELEASLEF